jgi:hypothetical protein
MNSLKNRSPLGSPGRHGNWRGLWGAAIEVIRFKAVYAWPGFFKESARLVPLDSASLGRPSGTIRSRLRLTRRYYPYRRYRGEDHVLVLGAGFTRPQGMTKKGFFLVMHRSYASKAA